MAIDINTARAGLDRNKYYKAVYVTNNKLTISAVCEGVFYSNDLEPMQMNNLSTTTSKRKQYIQKIYTTDYIPNLELDDCVVHNGEEWIVADLTVEDINANAKQFSRQSNKYVITLMR